MISFFVVAILFCVPRLFCAASFPVKSPRRRLHVDPFFVAADRFFAHTRSGSRGTEAQPHFLFWATLLSASILAQSYSPLDAAGSE
jgi:hypothetical protein